MSLILSGTDGLSDVDGSAATPAIRGTDANTGIFFPAADTIGFAEGGVEAMRLDSAGTLGLGVTPSAWTTYKALQISNGALIGFPNEIVGLTGNAYYNAGFKYISSGYATKYSQSESGSGQHAWFTAGSGTAGNAITFTQAMTLDSSGNLLVGTTSATNKRIAALVGNSTSNTIYYAESGSSYTGGHFVSASATAAGTGWYHMVCQSSGPTNNLLIFGNGNVQNANNSYGAISDAKLKENIVDATPKLAKLMQVRIRNYNLKGEYEQHKQIGVVAQELETVFPMMVDETSDKDAEGNDLGTTTKSVKYSVFVPMLIKAIQEQQAIIESLKARLDAANL